MKSPFFLSIITRTCMRPNFLMDNIFSVKNQSCKSVEQVFCVDRERSGLQAADRALAKNKHRVDGKFTFILDDDTWLINNQFVEHLKNFTDQYPQANIVMFKSKRPKGPPSNETIFPTRAVWNKTPKHGTTNCLCYAIRTRFWKQRIEYFGIKPHGGDWWLLDKLIQDGHKLFWLDELMAESRQLGRGRLFEPTKKGWFEKVARKEGLVNLGEDDWRLRLWKTL